jgi:flagellar assembly protein FliH
VTIRLSPADEQTLRRQVEQLVAAFSPLATVRMLADPAIAPGGCRLHTEFGVIDKQLSTQLERIKEELS